MNSTASDGYRQTSDRTQAESVGILELGPGADPDPRADRSVDILDLPTTDFEWDLNVTPWEPFADGCAAGVIANECIEHLQNPMATMGEIARILEPGGWAEFRVPFGLSHWFKDPTHPDFWTYDRAEYFEDNPDHDQNFYASFGLRLVERRFEDTYLKAPWLCKLSPLLRFAAGRWPGEWVVETPYANGTLVVRYEKKEADR